MFSDRTPGVLLRPQLIWLAASSLSCHRKTVWYMAGISMRPQRSANASHVHLHGGQCCHFVKREVSDACQDLHFGGMTAGPGRCCTDWFRQSRRNPVAEGHRSCQKGLQVQLQQAGNTTQA